MKTSKFILGALCTLLILSVSSCKEEKPHFTIEGEISGADSTMLYLQKQGLNEYALVDSVKLDSNGTFSFKQDAPQHGEFYTLILGNQVINLAIDSIETVVVKASKPTFAAQYTVEGSDESKLMKEIILEQYKLTNTVRSLMVKLQKKEISQDEYITDMNTAVAAYKTYAEKVIRSDYTSYASYFALFQKVGDLLIFDPYDKKDRSLYQAVATAWLHKDPESPRTKQLESFVLGILADIQREKDREQHIIELNNNMKEVDSQDFFKISLPDISNKQIELASLHGKVVLLDFTAYQTDYSPAHNILLNKVFEKYSGKVAIYQVSLDSDAHSWKNTATNLPWICVYDEKSLGSELIQKFNVQSLPTTYILDKKGNIVKRLLGSENIDDEIKKLL
ncbi:TlpA disulfide reductase family protein [Dysgonomonas sp. 25]|uniref:TlpA disulfide reductase family protein n=1 Tax=Dysgonomonas sp. 25 TaxID=2302933 RepID=UPI0013D75ED6|nr:TlpA disulfide reductase family protein [Dysgonomonas sp. 25]NDV68881.1 AhpC/TSA family protein [Dysgonomonas sp. 25]